jgi:hypothetical protein
VGNNNGVYTLSYGSDLYSTGTDIFNVNPTSGLMQLINNVDFAIKSSTDFFVEGTNGNLGFGTNTPGLTIDATAKTDGFGIPAGTTAQRIGANNQIRINTDSTGAAGLEWRVAGDWYNINDAPTGGGGGAVSGTTEYYFAGNSSQDTDSTITQDVWVDILIDSEMVKDASFTHSTTVAPEEITIDSTGTYTFDINARFDQNGDGRIDQYVQLWKDTGGGFVAVPEGFLYEGTAVFSTATISGYSIGGSFTIELDAGDVVKFRTYIDLIGSNGGNDPTFSPGTNVKVTRFK